MSDSPRTPGFGSRLELSVRIKRGERHKEETVFDSTVSIPVRSEERGDLEPFVDQWLATMDAALKLIPVIPKEDTLAS